MSDGPRPDPTPADPAAAPADPGRDRLRDAEHVLHGPEGSGAWRQLLYAVYLGTLLSGVYGFSVLRALVEVLGPRWRADGLVVPITVSAAALAAVVLVLGYLAGRRRGPVTPDLAWLDLVVSSSADRRLALREAWALPFTGLLAGGTVVGLVVGASLWGGGATGAVTAPAGVVLGALYGTTLALLWLAGQLAADPAGRGPGAGSAGRAVRTALRPRRALRLLGVEGLRAHSARSSRLGGAVLAGDPRALRLEAASPVRRGRHLRLRSRGPWRTLLARDVLGLRRQPLLLLGGVVLVATGATALGWYVTDASAPVVAAVLGVLVAHLGGGLWGEGNRLLGDTLGAPRLLGGSVLREAVTHSVLPAVLMLLVGAAAALPWEAGSPADLVAVLVTVVLVTLVVLAAQWVSAFRVLPPELALLPGTGTAVLLVWLAWPFVLALVGGTLLVVRVGGVLRGGSAGSAAFTVVLVLGALGGLARRALERAAVAHRD